MIKVPFLKKVVLNLVVDFRCRHFAFRGRPPSLLATSCLRGLACLAIPAGVFVPSTPINKVFTINMDL
jgi:hypothetical protein